MQDAELLFGAGRHKVLPFLWQNRQVGHTPFNVLFIVYVGWSKFHQMPHAPAYQIAVALQITVFAAGRTEDFCIGHSDGWLFRHD